MSREALARYSRLVWERGWVANHDGNLSVRCADGRFLATPTAESKRVIDEEMLVVVDLAGTVVEGSRRIFSEWNLHAVCFELRPDVGAVIHAHPPHATAAGLAGLDLTRPPLPEAVVSLGAVPAAEAALPGAAAVEALRPLVIEHDAYLLPGNGVLAVGDDLEQAYLRMELVEHLARIVGLARTMGRPRSLGVEQHAALLEKRAAAGLGPEGRRRKSKAAPPAAAAPSVTPASRAEVERLAMARASALTGDARLARVVTEEVLRALGLDP